MGPVFQGLHARQILTLWEMRDENRRRHESRETFARDTRSVRDYAGKFALDPADAQREFRQLVRAGYLTDARFQWINYWIVLKEENILLNFLTSLVVTVAVVLGTVPISAMLGYALARLKFPGKVLVLSLLIAGAVAPHQAVMVPVFEMLMSIRAPEGLWGMILWLVRGGAGNAILMAGFFWTLPREVEEAAHVDGAGPFRTFFDGALPMARPIVMIVPVILMFLLVQKHVVKAIAVGAVKG